MFAVTVEFLLGTYRADPDGLAATGQQTAGEWPPSVSRLFAAFVAADGTRDSCRVTDGSELLWLEQLPPPLIHADTRVPHQLLNPRYVVRQDQGPKKNTHQEYLARAGALSRPGVRVAPRMPKIVYRWDVESPSEEILEALQRRAARIGYFGTSDSPARMRVVRRMPELDFPKGAYVPDALGEEVVSVPQSGDLMVLDSMYDQWRDRGASLTRQQFPALRHEVAYRKPGLAKADNGKVVAWLRLGRSVSGRRLSTVTACFKDAVLSQFQSMYGEPPGVLHGHGFSGPGYEIARYLALPDVGFDHSKGRIHGLALWLPPGLDAEMQHKARDAVFAIRRLVAKGIDLRVSPWDSETARPLAANPRRWESTSRAWVTAVPAIHERRKALNLAELTRWCRHAGLPEPVAFRSTRAPLAHGALDLAPVEVNRPGRAGRPYSHLEVIFSEMVKGPVVIGSGRQRGFGLCVPVDRISGVER